MTVLPAQFTLNNFGLMNACMSTGCESAASLQRKYNVMVPVVFCQVEAMIFTHLTKAGERADATVGCRAKECGCACFLVALVVGSDSLKCGT